MFSIKSDKTIYLTRGDTAQINLALNVDGEPFVPQEGDAVVFTVKRDTALATAPLLTKAAEGLIISIKHEDTKDIEFSEASVHLYYDIEVTVGSTGEVMTDGPHDFFLLADVTS